MTQPALIVGDGFDRRLYKHCARAFVDSSGWPLPLSIGLSRTLQLALHHEDFLDVVEFVGDKAMLIDASNARAVMRINGKVVAYAERGTLVPEKPGWLSLRNLILAKGGYSLLLDPDEEEFQDLDEEDYKRLLDWLLEQGWRAPSWYDALSKEFEVEIRNSDGDSTFFGSCWADKGGLGLSQMPTTEPLPSVDFCTLDLV